MFDGRISLILCHTSGKIILLEKNFFQIHYISGNYAQCMENTMNLISSVDFCVFDVNSEKFTELLNF